MRFQLFNQGFLFSSTSQKKDFFIYDGVFSIPRLIRKVNGSGKKKLTGWSLKVELLNVKTV